MSGLGDSNAHFTWNGGDLDGLGELAVEEHVLLTARSAKCYIDSGFHHVSIMRLSPSQKIETSDILTY